MPHTTSDKKKAEAFLKLQSKPGRKKFVPSLRPTQKLMLEESEVLNVRNSVIIFPKV